MFEKYYSNHESFSSESGIAAIGTTGNGLAYFLAPVVIIMLQRWPSQRKNVSLVGLGIIAVALVAASFAEHVFHLIITQGALYGVGGAMMYNPFIFYLDEWFIERKELAYGIFWAGAGLCSAIIPFVMEWALSEYGFRATLRAWAVFLVCGPSFHYGVVVGIIIESDSIDIGDHTVAVDLLRQASTPSPIQRCRL